MPWTYDATDLTTDLAKVRLKLGDTKVKDQQFSDEEIAVFLAETGSVEGAVARGARALAFRYSRESDKWVGDLKILASQKSRAYRDMALAMGSAAAVFRGIPSAGGIRTSQKDDYNNDNALVVPSFRRNQHDNVE